MVVTVPFRALAELDGSDGQGNSYHFLATGAGSATASFRHVYRNAYLLQGIQYDFIALPEPATMTLAGLGLLAVVLLRRRAVSAAGRTSSTGREKHPADHTSA